MNYSTHLPHENEHREYKKAKKAFPKDAWESISAFENTDGGLLILGITETDHKFLATGVTDAQGICDEFWSNINNGMVSNNNFKNEDVMIVNIDQQTQIIEITVHEADDKDKPVYI